MCVICVKPKNVAMPSRNLLLQMYSANPDGCGFVASESGDWHSLSFDDFYKHLQRVQKREACIIHFRWATQGSVNILNCHPFRAGNTYFAHNGVLPVPAERDMTDSELCFRHTLIPIISTYGWVNGTPYIDAVRGTSRFAFMQYGQVHLYGDFVKYEKCFYSNLNFLRWYHAYYDTL